MDEVTPLTDYRDVAHRDHSADNWSDQQKWHGANYTRRPNSTHTGEPRRSMRREPWLTADQPGGVRPAQFPLLLRSLSMAMCETEYQYRHLTFI